MQLKIIFTQQGVLLLSEFRKRTVLLFLFYIQRPSLHLLGNFFVGYTPGFMVWIRKAFTILHVFI